MPGQVSNAEKSFRKATETIGTATEIVNNLGMVSGPLGVILDGLGTALNFVNFGFDIADVARSGGNPTENGLKIAEAVVRTVPIVGTVIKAGEIAEQAIPAYVNANAGNSHGIGSPDMVSVQQMANKFLFGM
jgi:hypothetical protein